MIRRASRGRRVSRSTPKPTRRIPRKPPRSGFSAPGRVSRLPPRTGGLGGKMVQKTGTKFGKTGVMRPGNRISRGQIRNPRAGGSSQGGRRNRSLNRDPALGDPQIQQKKPRGTIHKPTRIGRSPNKGRSLTKLYLARARQQELSDRYGITTYNDDGTVSTIPTIRLPDGEPYDPNVAYDFDGKGGYTKVPKRGGF